MNRSTRTIVVVTVAMVTAAAASLGVYAAVKNIPVREVEVAHHFVAVASRPLPNGTRLAAEDVKLVAWPSSSPVAGSFAKVEGVVNRGLVAPVQEHEPLTETKLAPIAAGAGLPPSIPTGMRAMSVKVDEVIGVAGFVVPGTRVDVVVTIRSVAGTSDDKESMSRTVVSNVLVLTAGTKLDQEQAKEGKPQQSTVVTLAVLPEDAERVALASSEGRISLALRNPLDTAPTQTRGVQVTGLMKGGTAPVHAEAPAKPARRPVAQRQVSVSLPAPTLPPPPPVYRVETIRAAKRSEEVVH